MNSQAKIHCTCLWLNKHISEWSPSTSHWVVVKCYSYWNDKVRVHPDYARNTRTTRTMYCRQIGHSDSLLPQAVHVTMCPQSSSRQSVTASMHTLHKLLSKAALGLSPDELVTTTITCNNNIINHQQSPVASTITFTGSLATFQLGHILPRQHIKAVHRCPATYTVWVHHTHLCFNCAYCM